MFIYINKYVHRFESQKPFFVGYRNHLIWHGWCAWTSLCLVASPVSLSNSATKIFLLPWQATSFSPKWATGCFCFSRVVIVVLVVPLNTAVWKWFLLVLFLTKNTAIGYGANPFVMYVNFNVSQKPLPFDICILKAMTVTPSHILPWVLLFNILLFLHPCVRCLLARTVLQYSQENSMIIPMCC